MSTTDILLGVDIGTSDTKVLATTLEGREISWVAVATHWDTRPGSLTETSPDRLYTAVLALMEQALTTAQQLTGPGPRAGHRDHRARRGGRPAGPAAPPGAPDHRLVRPTGE